jgi:hypothetical protein
MTAWTLFSSKTRNWRACMFNLTIERPDCFSKAQKTVLEIFKDSHSVDSLLNSLKTMRFITTSYKIDKDGCHVWLIDKLDFKERRAAIFEEVECT